MQDVLKNRPIVDFQIPENVVFTKIDSKTGLLVSPHSEKIVVQAFEQGTAPTEYTPRPESAKIDQFLQFDMDHANDG
jgi:penicillin-binding protein 1A